MWFGFSCVLVLFNLVLRLLPICIRWIAVVSSLLMDFVSSLRNLRDQIGRCIFVGGWFGFQVTM
jgi:hypothetical protein